MECGAKQKQPELMMACNRIMGQGETDWAFEKKKDRTNRTFVISFRGLHKLSDIKELGKFVVKTLSMGVRSQGPGRK